MWFPKPHGPCDVKINIPFTWHKLFSADGQRTIVEATVVGEGERAAVRNGGWGEQTLLSRAGTRETPKTTLLTKASVQTWHLGLGSGLQLGGTWRGHPLCPAHSPRWEVRWWVLILSVQDCLWQLQLAARRPALATLPLTNHTVSGTLDPQKTSC